ncbi:MAG: FtsH protease activity modulator HflK [Candidatus Poribacteria bacterium]|jgi:membrane protease subunit HflK|nr:FtsH protease activity modulator HflK [Candidatus Poribacteria bacterium]MDP6749640.1 FtsH protease activity modulator HflK [Candidatus Poribacteria bacterium]
MKDFNPTEILDTLQPDLNQFSVKHLIWVVIAVLILYGSATSVYTVPEDSKAVVLRFGKDTRQEEPGLHFKLPFGIEKHYPVPVKRIFKEEFGFRTLKASVTTQYDSRDYPSESLMLTGDLNIADVEWVVQYKIFDPRQYMFAIRDPQQALRDLSESVMRLVVGDQTATQVLTVGRSEITSEVEQKLQDLLNLYKTGLRVESVTLQDVNPPEMVKPAFNSVNEAKQEKEKLINEAREERNTTVPEAIGLAKQKVTEAEGYALKRVNQAQGDADRFISILNAYKSAKEVTRQRLYLETMAEVLPAVEEVYVIDGKSNTPLPILQLGRGGK